MSTSSTCSRSGAAWMACHSRERNRKLLPLPVVPAQSTWAVSACPRSSRGRSAQHVKAQLQGESAPGCRMATVDHAPRGSSNSTRTADLARATRQFPCRLGKQTLRQGRSPAQDPHWCAAPRKSDCAHAVDDRPAGLAAILYSAENATQGRAASWCKGWSHGRTSSVNRPTSAMNSVISSRIIANRIGADHQRCSTCKAHRKRQ